LLEIAEELIARQPPEAQALRRCGSNRTWAATKRRPRRASKRLGCGRSSRRDSQSLPSVPRIPIAHRDWDTPAGCNVIAFLAAALEAHFAGQPTFSLLPSLLSVATIPLAW